MDVGSLSWTRCEFGLSLPERTGPGWAHRPMPAWTRCPCPCPSLAQRARRPSMSLPDTFADMHALKYTDTQCLTVELRAIRPCPALPILAAASCWLRKMENHTPPKE